MRRVPPSSLVASLVLACLPMTVVRAAAPEAEPGFTQLGAHVHGKVVVNLALEGNTLRVELDAPAINVVGFEHAPRTEAERRAVAIVDRWLASGAGILGVPAAARCALGKVEYQPPKLADDHEAGHDHEPGHEDGADHADYEASYTFTCANPAALAWSELWLVQRLRRVAEIELNLVTPQAQSQRTLGADAARIDRR